MSKEYEYIQTCDCKSCIHKPICRILEGKENLKTEMETFIFNAIKRDSSIAAEPLSVNINCKYYTNTVNPPYVNYRGEVGNLKIDSVPQPTDIKTARNFPDSTTSFSYGSTTAESTKVEKRGI